MAAARSKAVFKETARRLPEMARILMGPFFITKEPPHNRPRLFSNRNDSCKYSVEELAAQRDQVEARGEA
jgi:hypothetical protein